MRFDGQYAYNMTDKLSYPRMVGSEGNEKARNEIEAEMRSIGLDTVREDFNASTFPMGMLARWVLLVVAAPIMIGALLYKTGHPGWSFIFSLITVYFGYKASGIAHNFQDFLQYGDQVPTQNLTGRFPGGGDCGHVVLMAHFDTKSQPFPIELRIAAYLLGGLLVLIGTIWLFMASAGTILGLWTTGGTALLVIAILGTLISASLIWNTVENFSPGSLDNAAGVGVILGIARAWAADTPEGLSLTVVPTSAEEMGLQGAERWIEKHAAELDPEKTIFLNFDGPGSKTGRIIVTTTFGLPRRDISGPELKEDFLSACRELNIDNVKDVYIPFGASTDMMPLSYRGFKVLNMGSLSRGVHTTKDNMEQVDAGELKKVGDIGIKVIQRFKARSS